MNNKLIDVVIPTHIKDIDLLDLCIKQAKENVIDVNNIYVVSIEKYTDEAIWVPQTVLPFSLEDISNIVGKHCRTGWYYGLTIQITAGLYIPNLKNNVLLLDTDTMFLTPTKFLENGKALYNVSYDTIDPRNPYYEHMWKLIPGLIKQNEYSGIAMHQLMQRDILEEMSILVESIHKKSFWKAFVDVTTEPYETLQGDQRHEFCTGKLTAYELYFNYMLKYHPDRIDIVKKNSILAYKGRLGVDGTIDHNYPSRTNLSGDIRVIQREEELTFKFDNIRDSMKHIMKRCKDLGYNAITFQNHTRIGFEDHKKILMEQIK